jgi:hypothetical protein
VQDIGPLDVRDYLEAAKANGLSTATLKQHMAAVRMLFDHLVTGGVLAHNPALSVKAPRQKLGKGKTPVLTCRGVVWEDAICPDNVSATNAWMPRPKPHRHVGPGKIMALRTGSIALLANAAWRLQDFRI